VRAISSKKPEHENRCQVQPQQQTHHNRFDKPFFHASRL
jgi:hypothetical protein